MSDNGLFGKKKQPLTKVALWGLLLLVICLWVSIAQISGLKKAYRKDLTQTFQDQHMSAATALNEYFNKVYVDSKNGASLMGNNQYGYNEKRINTVIKAVDAVESVERSCFVSGDTLYYADGSCNIEDNDPVWGDMWNSPASRLETVGGIFNYYHGEENDGYEYIAVSPVYYNHAYAGSFMVMISIDGLFEKDIFDFQNANGESYLIDKDMKIFVRSQSASMLPVEEEDLLKGIGEYSDGKSSTIQTISSVRHSLANKQPGYITVDTKDHKGLQVSFCPLEGSKNIYFASCYSDKLVSDKVAPLAVRSIFTAIVLLAVMVIVILYVWNQAKKSNVTIEKMAYEDPVTSGKNINYFKDFAINSLLEHSEVPFMIYRFDIINFRFINEAYGHERADEVLRAVIKAFSVAFTERELCVRMNADQFLALIVNDKNTEHRLELFAEKVSEAARNNGVKYPVKFKYGVYQVKKHDSDIDIMIDHANVARKTVDSASTELRAYFTDDVIGDMRRVDSIESDMEKALESGEFKVFYQPKWDVVANHVAGAEALVRWERQDGSIIKPEMFIPIFEKNGFVEKLDFYTLEEVCKHMRKCLDEGKTVYPVSVNQSRLLLHNLDYVDNVDKIIKKYNIPENAIELEITETVFADEKDAMFESMRKLKQSGVKLSMDDFGSGYSSLNMLKDAPFDIIKIDKEFFSESVTSDVSMWILQKMIEMINGLGMEVICEGVETGEQALLLRSIGCRLVQGYFYAKPMPVEEYDERYY